MKNHYISLTDSQLVNLISFFDLTLVQHIRADEEIDNIMYLYDLADTYRKLIEAQNATD